MPSESLRVLLVEDRAEDAELASRELGRTALECATRRVETAAAFRRALADFAPNLVLADYTVPGFGGMAALEILRAEAPTIPLIIVTGSLDEETAAECIKAGAADYVLKTNLVRLGPAVRGALALAKSQARTRSLEAQLLESQKMEAVGRLAGGVAHDFNNILTAIGGYTDLLLADLPPGDRRREDVDEIHRAAQRAAALTQQLLAFSRRQVVVSDTGVGMSEETKTHIFEPFFTTKVRGKGTGLGLATVYGIVQQTGGHIWAYSERGSGTTMRVYLPRVDQPPDPIERPAEAPAESLRGSETILLVEDEAAVRAVTRQLLERNGYKVIEAADGPAAIALVDGGKEKPQLDLLLTDVVMPGMSGRELADHMLARCPRLRVLFMSGYTDDAIVRHGMLEPGLAYLEKPFRPANLLRKVRDTLTRPH